MSPHSKCSQHLSSQHFGAWAIIHGQGYSNQQTTHFLSWTNCFDPRKTNPISVFVLIRIDVCLTNWRKNEPNVNLNRLQLVTHSLRTIRSGWVWSKRKNWSIFYGMAINRHSWRSRSSSYRLANMLWEYEMVCADSLNNRSNGKSTHFLHQIN